MTPIRYLGVCSVAAALSACGDSTTGSGGWGGPGAGSSGGGSGGATNAVAGSSSGGASGSSSGGASKMPSSSGGAVSSGSSGARSGSGSSGGTAISGSSGSSGATSSGSGSSGGSGSGGADAGMTSADSGSTDPEIAYSVTLMMDAFNVSAGQEIYMCQDFANPFKGQQADIKTYQLAMSTGSHHMFAFYTGGATNGSVATCPQGGLQFGAFSFSAQSPNVTQTYPEGIGATIPTGTGFTLNVHYINAGSTSIPGQVSLTMSVAKPGVITQHAGVLFLNQISLSVPTGATVMNPYTASSTYTLTQDVNILWSASHMHKRATNFVATTSTGQTLFQTTQWAEPPPQTYSPPLPLTSGTSITWACSYYNDTQQPLTFGESASSNVMCISSSVFYPVQDINNPIISVMQ